MLDVVENITRYLKMIIGMARVLVRFMTTLKTAGVYDDPTIKEINDLYLQFWNHDDSAKAVTRDDYSPGDLQTIARQFLVTIHKL